MTAVLEAACVCYICETKTGKGSNDLYNNSVDVIDLTVALLLACDFGSKVNDK